MREDLMKTKLVVAMVGGLLLAAVPVIAHHSFAAEYDSAKPITLQGKVTKVEFMNPHIWVYLNAKDEGGKMATWQCEGGAPNSLKRQGWSKDSLKEGDEITIEGFRAKDGTNTCNSRSVKLSDGRKLFAGSAEDGGPNAKGAPKE
jgi:uncharacterized protein DUF6152